MSSECLAGRPYPRDTRETQLSPSGLTFHIPDMCKARASFHGMLSREMPAKIFLASIAIVDVYEAILFYASIAHSRTERSGN